VLTFKRGINSNAPFCFQLQEVNSMWRKLFLSCLFVLVLFSQGYGAEERYTIPIDNCPILGPENAPITIVEFLDFQ
jgi:hypothetical protein